MEINIKEVPNALEPKVEHKEIPIEEKNWGPEAPNVRFFKDFSALADRAKTLSDGEIRHWIINGQINPKIMELVRMMAQFDNERQQVLKDRGELQE